MLNSLENRILSFYDSIDLGRCELCRQCRAENPNLYARAVGAWFVGSKYERQEKRILFVGKNARGVPAADYEENRNGKGFLEEFRYSRERLWHLSWAYWRYTAEICGRLFGPAGMEAVAFTNMVKCNSSPSRDTTTDSMKDYCVHRLGVARGEIEILKPTHVVCYTGTSYDRWLPDLFDTMECLQSEYIAIGNKRMPYAAYKCGSGGSKVSVLRIGHPERMQKEAYVSSVVHWVNEN